MLIEDLLQEAYLPTLGENFKELIKEREEQSNSIALSTLLKRLAQVIVYKFAKKASFKLETQTLTEYKETAIQ